KGSAARAEPAPQGDFLPRSHRSGEGPQAIASWLSPGLAGPGPAEPLPAIVRECLVRLSHPVRVFLLLDGRSLSAARGEELRGQSLGHALLRAPAREPDQPTGGERRAPLRPHLDRDLVRRATHAP